jgi:hypothetical protein
MSSETVSSYWPLTAQLLQVYLPAIEGHVPRDCVRSFRAFLEFCYIARRNVHNESTLEDLHNALQCFPQYRTVFETTGVRVDFNLPRQHFMTHYYQLIWLFGAPNGLCSSITESKHIKAVKEPWRRSNRYEALGQMLLTNQRLDKLAAARVDFARRKMLEGTCLSAFCILGKTCFLVLYVSLLTVAFQICHLTVIPVIVWMIISGLMTM